MGKSYYTMYVFRGSTDQINQIEYEANRYDLTLRQTFSGDNVERYEFDVDEEIPYTHPFVCYLYDFDNIGLSGPPIAMRVPEPLYVPNMIDTLTELMLPEVAVLDEVEIKERVQTVVTEIEKVKKKRP